MNTIMVSLLSEGVKLVTVPKFSPDIFLKVLNEYHPTFAYLVPPISKHPDYRQNHRDNTQIN